MAGVGQKADHKGKGKTTPFCAEKTYKRKTLLS